MFDRSETKKAELAPQLVALEHQLACMEVAPLHIDRDRLMFDAGRAAGLEERAIAATQRVAGAPRWFWPSAAAMMTAACVVLAAMLVWRGDAALVAQGDAKPQADGEQEAEIVAPDVERLAVLPDMSNWAVRPADGYLQKRYIALTRGVGELHSEDDGGVLLKPANSTQPATARELLRELVPTRTPVPSNS